MGGRLNRNKNFHRPVTWIEPSGNAVKANNLQELLRTIQRLRMAEGGDLNPGWHLRVQDDVCAQEHNSSLCIKVDDRESQQESVKYINRTDVQRFFNAVKGFIASGGELVEQDEADRRAQICLKCPSNVPIRGCMGCSGLIPKLLKLTKGASTEYDKELKGCGVCGCQLKAKVHLPTELSEDDDLEFPAHCWLSD